MKIKAKGKLLRLSIEVIDVEEEYEDSDMTVADYQNEIRKEMLKSSDSVSDKDVRYAVQDHVLDWGQDLLIENVDQTNKLAKEEFRNVLAHYDVTLRNFAEYYGSTSNYMLVDVSAKLQDD